MIVLWLLVIGGIGWAIARSVQRDSEAPFSPAPREGPLEVLERRYAEGALSTEEYEERKQRLQEDRR